MNLGLTLSLGGRSAGAAADTGPLDFIGYGQSNWLFHVTNVTSAPAANAGTFQWDHGTSQFITPVGNGIRTFLNAMQAATGRDCRLVSGGVSGVPISALQKGDASGAYTDLLNRVTASGIDPDFIIFHHGEGDAEGIDPQIATYQAAMNQLHTDIATDTGNTISSLPFICSGLGRRNPAGDAASEAKWALIKTAQSTVNSTYPNIHYSHSNGDAALVDAVHWTGPSYGRSGSRYARTVQVLMGSQSTRPLWNLVSAERVTTTTTRLVVAYGMGSDFTPTTGITGFSLSGDNGASYITATGARESATQILLTHADLGTTERLIRYQYGSGFDITAPALDNSALVNNLSFTTTPIVASGTAPLPAFTWANSLSAGSSGTTQTFASITVPGGSAELLAVIGVTAQFSPSITSLTVTAQPSGTPVVATAIINHADVSPSARLFQAVLPSGTTSVTTEIVYSSNPFATTRIHISTVPTANLSSTTAVASGTAVTTGTNTASVNIATSAAGAIFAVASNGTTSGTGSFSGTETFTTRNTAVANGAVHAVADANNVAASGSNAVTATFTVSGTETRVAAASWR